MTQTVSSMVESLEEKIFDLNIQEGKKKKRIQPKLEGEGSNCSWFVIWFNPLLRAKNGSLFKDLT